MSSSSNRAPRRFVCHCELAQKIWISNRNPREDDGLCGPLIEDGSRRLGSRWFGSRRVGSRIFSIRKFSSSRFCSSIFGSRSRSGFILETQTEDFFCELRIASEGNPISNNCIFRVELHRESA